MLWSTLYCTNESSSVHMLPKLRGMRVFWQRRTDFHPPPVFRRPSGTSGFNPAAAQPQLNVYSLITLY